MKDSYRIAAAVAVVLATSAMAHATFTTYSDRGSFLAALPGPAETESFEDEAIDVQTGGRTISTSTSDITYVGTATFGVNDVVAGGRGPTDGAQYLQVGFIATSEVLFEFDAPLLAFGVDVVDKNVNDLDAVIDDAGINSVINQAGEGVVQFFGVIATPDMAFSKVGFAGLGPSVPGDTFALDDAVFVRIPEPSSIALAVAALVVVGARRRVA